MRVAIVTPYFRESRVQLERCIESVRRQLEPGVIHMMVADGHPQAWIDTVPELRHLKLDRAHGDFGNTPRALGGLLAASEGFDAIGFLDADNWLDPDHVGHCLDTAAATGDIDYVVARRRLVRDDGTVVPVVTRDDRDGSHVDTNCYLLLPGAFHAIGQWAVMPKALSIVGDRVFLNSLRVQKLGHATCARPTVNYLCTWAEMFRAAGETPPSYAKQNVDLAPTLRWWKGLDERDRCVVNRLAGADLAATGVLP